MSARGVRRKYDSDFKRNAVLLSEDPDRTVASVARELGVNENQLYRWRQRLSVDGSRAFPGHGRQNLTPEQQRIRELEKTLVDVTMERDILKKAVAVFSKAPR
jgi:transposase